MRIAFCGTPDFAVPSFQMLIDEGHELALFTNPDPSGTALMLADAVASALPYDAEYVYDRHERREKRPAHEIGISAIRGGTIVGEHSVLFCGRDEIIEIKHTALSREVFAVGAVDAAAFMAERTQPGMYDMSDVIASHK